MDDLLLRAIDLARLRGAQYADARLVHTIEQRVLVQNGAAQALEQQESAGFGVRVLVNGGWGFAASRELTGAEVGRVTDQALGIARASAHIPARQAVDLGPAVSSQGRYQTPVRIDPFAVPLEEKLALLLEAEANMRGEAGAVVRQGSLAAVRKQQHFANSDGALLEQTITECGGGLAVTAVGSGGVQTRSYPAPNGGWHGTGGWELVLGWDLPGNAARVASEAVQLLTAEPCPVDVRTTVILGGSQLAMQIHESCGHAAELDRVYGAEAAYAGTSFLTPDKLGGFRYGSDVVNLTADAIQPGGLGTFGWDDEGVPAQRTPLVREGLLVGYLTSRETAARLGMAANGCMRAAGWNYLPLIRMPNVSLEPGAWSLEAMIADTDDGIYMDSNRSWSIDDRRYNFHFGTEVGYEIRNGKLGRLLRNCSYTGNTPEFWNGCDAIGRADEWQMWSVVYCGKGQPAQVVRTGHGAAPARFRHVRVGV